MSGMRERQESNTDFEKTKDFNGQKAKSKNPKGKKCTQVPGQKGWQEL